MLLLPFTSIVWCSPIQRPLSLQLGCSHPFTTRLHNHASIRCAMGRWRNRTTVHTWRESPQTQLALLLPIFFAHVYWVPDASVVLAPRQNGIALHADHLDCAIGTVVLMRCAPIIWHSVLSSRPWATVTTSRQALLSTTASLASAYLISGFFGPILPCVLSFLLGRELNAGCQQATRVLGGHLAWICMGTRLLNNELSPFLPPPFGRGRWFRFYLRSHWLPWVLGGYFVSLLAYNSIEVLNALLLPPRSMDMESCMHFLEEQSDLLPLAIGCVGPCVTAPVFEEVLYRGFLLPALTRFLPLAAALPMHSALFALHHNSVTGFLPLAVLGLIWALVYMGSGNLVVPIMIHAMWNSRIFLRAALFQS
mmetsp:Transcript_49411/g.122798  ORF Transcript_49411/g.122798 Transcript_49411/m.122798 type:complete len:365 (+) Transcript_49411:46-1140(+)